MFRIAFEARLCREEEGCYDLLGHSTPDLHFYLSLRDDVPVTEDGGRKPLDCLLRIERKLHDRIKISYPVAGFEDRFRTDLFTALKLTEAERRSLAPAPALLAICARPIRDFHPDVHRSALIDLTPYYEAGGLFNAISFGTRLSALRQIIEDRGDLFTALAPEKPRGPDWSEAVTARVGFKGVSVDLKALYKLWRGRPKG